MNTSLPSRAVLLPHGGARFVERLFVLVAIIILSGAFIPLLSTGGGYATDVYSPVYTLTLAGLFVFSFLFSLTQASNISLLFTRHMPLLLFLLWQFLCCLWAESPLLTFQGAAGALITSLLAFYIVCRFRTEEYLPLLGLALACIVIGSVVFVYTMPGIAYQPNSWSWRGAFINRNAFGTYTALCALVFLVAFLSYRPSKFLSLFMCLFSLYVLYKTQSKTPLLSLMAGVAGCWLILLIYRLDRTRATLLTMVACIGSVGVFLLMTQDIEESLSLVNREADFSGRAEAWQIILDRIMERPLLGYGTIRLDDELLAPHNMWLAIWLKNGLIGLLLFVWFFVRSTARILILSARAAWPERMFFMALFIFIFFRGFMESLYFSTLLWVLLLIPAISPAYPGNFISRGYIYVSLITWALVLLSILMPIMTLITSGNYMMPA